MYGYILTAHGLWRWVVILAGLLTVGDAIKRSRRTHGLAPGRPYARFFSIALDIQVLMGVALYMFFSPFTSAAYNSVNVPQAPQVVFIAEYHVAFMFTAFLCVHLASPLIRRARTDVGRQRLGVACYGVTLLLILVGVPWWRPLLRI